MTGLFRSTQHALLFAFRHAGQAYDRPLMLRMADATRGPGAGLVGLDGAAQAGMIRAEVADLGRLYEAVIVARFADRSIPCQCKAACCSGERLNGEWINAVAYLADYVRTSALAGCVSTGLLRREYVARYFAKDRRESIRDIAGRHGVDQRTAGAHAGRVAIFLGGSAHGVEQAAIDAITDKLYAAGVVE
jgi:hypothetical protein